MPADGSGNISGHYMNSLNSFIENFPDEKDALMKALNNDETEAAAKSLLVIKAMLDSVHADELAKECLQHSTKIAAVSDDKTPERAKAYVAVLLSAVTALSIDIQMAILGEEAAEFLTTAEETAETGDPSEREGGERPAPKQKGKDGKLKEILAVDDDTYCLDMFKEALQDVPCKVIGVTSGQAAINVLTARQPDLFALDIEMPLMDGLTLARHIRERGIETPIIFITGNSTRDFVIKAIKAGATDFIVKPINPSRVVERISRFL
jgi:CheY-like chemotaxis protein